MHILTQSLPREAEVGKMFLARHCRQFAPLCLLTTVGCSLESGHPSSPSGHHPLMTQAMHEQLRRETWIERPNPPSPAPIANSFLPPLFHSDMPDSTGLGGCFGMCRSLCAFHWCSQQHASPCTAGSAFITRKVVLAEH